jgi:hypothetical protein
LNTLCSCGIQFHMRLSLLGIGEKIARLKFLAIGSLPNLKLLRLLQFAQ